MIGDDPRLAGLHETLEFGREARLAHALIGHRGRTPEKTLEYVHQKLQATEPGCGPFIEDWFDERAETLTGTAVKAIESLKPGHFLVFENVRRTASRCDSGRPTPEQLPGVADDFERIARAFRQGATVYVNDAIASGNKDFSTTALPLAMGRVALGAFTRRELAEHVVRAREAGLVSFSGMKLDKLKQLHGIVKQGRVEMILAGGSLAMALLKARAEIDGTEVSIGAAGESGQQGGEGLHPALRHRDGPADARSTRTRGAWRSCCPSTSSSRTVRSRSEIPAGAWQRDIGPATRTLFDEKARAWAEQDLPPRGLPQRRHGPVRGLDLRRRHGGHGRDAQGRCRRAASASTWAAARAARPWSASAPSATSPTPSRPAARS